MNKHKGKKKEEEKGEDDEKKEGTMALLRDESFQHMA